MAPRKLASPEFKVLKTVCSRRHFMAGAAASSFTLAGATGAAAQEHGGSSLRQAIAAAVLPDPELAAFYSARSYAPLWLNEGVPGPAVSLLLEQLSAAGLDGLQPQAYLAVARTALRAAASAAPAGLANADIALSRTFANYVQDTRRAPPLGVIYGEPAFKNPPPVLNVLMDADAAPTLGAYIETMGWMHPHYRELRKALGQSLDGPGNKDQLLRLNLARARALPAHLSRYVLVDTTAAKLFYYENGKLRHTMRVVVGTPDDPTPMMVSTIYYATLKPYWHVPPDLAQERIAPRVVAEGLGYFEGRGYEVSTDWTENARVIDPGSVDWKAVSAGKQKVFVRQKPGPRNGMGNFKFQFSNELGIYLHDTSAKQLFAQDQRGVSAGCVRLEDAELFGALINGGAPLPAADRPEQHVLLPDGVPIFITYLTAVVEEGQVVERGDPYGWDKSHLANLHP